MTLYFSATFSPTFVRVYLVMSYPPRDSIQASSKLTGDAHGKQAIGSSLDIENVLRHLQQVIPIVSAMSRQQVSRSPRPLGRSSVPRRGSCRKRERPATPQHQQNRSQASSSQSHLFGHDASSVTHCHTLDSSSDSTVNLTGLDLQRNVVDGSQTGRALSVQ